LSLALGCTLLGLARVPARVLRLERQAATKGTVIL